MYGQDKRKQSLYFPSAMMIGLNFEAQRLDRSLSWVVQYAVNHGGLDAVKKLESVKPAVPRR